MILDILSASLTGNLLADRGVIQAGEETDRTDQNL